MPQLCLVALDIAQSHLLVLAQLRHERLQDLAHSEPGYFNYEPVEVFEGMCIFEISLSLHRKSISASALHVRVKVNWIEV
jgi:hypothetical protein